ncbi:CDC27 family protein [Microbulbifer bruguierae]|uniref:CDC27 family protein n=1 Tax=Microbulbifer bruguierae TaxID=3029061 RepID=A0ABY8NF33_9GAMM|nr:tetratricopeptide repeat protein [Microbulbifer bruguierae]WGL16352.1 CDC27 family protein [Microbulbifer bruguierae]
MPTTHIETSWLLSGAVLLGEPLERASLPDDPILALPEDMQAYLSQLAPGASPDNRLQALLKAFQRREFTVEYDAQATLTAEETYRQQKGNCMAFTVMMVAMARELGANAYFNQVEVPPVWEHEEPQTFVVYRHINMVSESARGRRVVDFNLAAYDPIYDQRELSDAEAFAQYYSNRGIEWMRQGSQAEAFRYMRKALMLHPGSADLWANLGALYSRNQKFDAAEQSYLQALQLDTQHAISMSNLERLYRKGERIALADYYAERARYHREHNPYYLYYQARNAYEHGDYLSAKKQLKRAIWQYKGDHRFHFLMGLASFRLGDYQDSRDHFFEAFHHANNSPARGVYLRKLELMDQQGLGGQQDKRSRVQWRTSRPVNPSNLLDRW